MMILSCIPLSLHYKQYSEMTPARRIVNVEAGPLVTLLVHGKLVSLLPE